MDYYQQGNEALLQKTTWGILASRNLRPHVTNKLFKVIKTVDKLENIFAGGWHSPIEKEVHQYLVRKSIPHVHFEAKGLPHAGCDLSGSDKLFITHCEPKTKRINRRNALKRNRLVCELCDGLLIPWVNPDGSTHELVKEVCGEKPVTVLDPENNEVLINEGAQTVEEFLSK
jgi:predicted Rossmann fold nucleotide-binding protein DprA/Smf involved in DNA uptake